MSKSEPQKGPDAAPSDAAVDVANSVESLSDDQLKTLLEQSRIVIRPGGEVVIENLTADLLDVAYELDPENPGVTCDAPELEGAGDATETET